MHTTKNGEPVIVLKAINVKKCYVDDKLIHAKKVIEKSKVHLITFFHYVIN